MMSMNLSMNCFVKNPGFMILGLFSVHIGFDTVYFNILGIIIKYTTYSGVII